MRMVACVVVLLPAVACAQDRAELVQRVERWSTQAEAPGATLEARLEAIDRAIRQREALMSTLSGDAHRPIWLLDQATDTLTRLTLTMTDTRMVVGLLDTGELQRAVEAAEAAYAMADTAGAMIAKRFEDQRKILEGGGQLAEGDRTLNRRLAESEQAVRRPLLMGRAMALQVAAGGEVADANEVITLLEGVRLSPGSARAVRDVSMAIALMDSPGREGRARELLDAVLAVPDAGDALLAEAALLRAKLAADVSAKEAAIAEAAQLAPFVDAQGLVSAPLAVLTVEAGARMLLESGRAEAAARVVMALPTRRDFGGTAQQIEGVVDDRLAAIAERIEDWSEIEPDVVLRAAAALVSRDRADYDARASAMLEGLIARFDAMKARVEKDGKAFVPPAEQTPAMELLARLCLVRAQRDGGEATTLRARAIELVVRLLEDENADLAGLLAPTATLVLGAAEEVPVGARRRLLQAGIDREPQHAQADRWRLGLAAMLINEDRDWAQALELARAAARSREAETRSQAVSLIGAVHTVLAAQEEPSLDTLREALAFVKQHPSSTSLDADGLALRVATMLVARGRAEAAREALAALGSDQGKRATILRARALAQLGRKGEAVAAFRRASELVSIEADGQTYWLVWTALLELVDEERRTRLAEGNEQAAQPLAASLRAHLIKLRAVDAGLGGPPYAGRLSAIEARLDP